MTAPWVAIAYRDRSYDYYVKTDVASNDPKRLGAFIPASVE